MRQHKTEFLDICGVTKSSLLSFIHWPYQNMRRICCISCIFFVYLKLQKPL